MGVPKAKKTENPKNIDQLKSEVASFASSIGLSQSIPSSLPNSGFDDTDFRKNGPIKRSKPPKPPKCETSADKNPTPQTKKFEKNKKNNRSRVRAAPPRPIDHRNEIRQVNYVEKNSKGKDLPKLPLMKASLLSGEWFVDSTELESKVLGNGEGRSIEVKGKEDVKALALKKKEVAERLLEQYSRDYETSRGRSGDIRMVAATQRSGTAADKVSAFAVMLEDNPIANLRSLDALLAMVTSKVGKRHALTGFDALKELFLRLLPDRKLKSLLQRPLFLLPESKDGFSLLLFWYWEECLKLRYERFIIALEDASKDMLPILKDKALKTIYFLLRSKSEQERRLLSALVNKLGDPERKAASCAGYQLSCLLSAHPNMKAVVIDEVDSFLFRPHLGTRAKYHAVNFLSQILLSKKGDGPKVAKRLVDVYFALFKVLISEEGGGKKNEKNSKKDDKKVNISQNSKGESPLEPNVEMDSRLLSSLLTGVNRAFPFVASDEADDVIEVQTPLLFKLVHSNNFNVGVQALMLLYQISSKNQIASDRFYRALYSKLLIPVVMNSSKPEMFLGLLFKAMKADVNLKRVSAFSKRLLQVALQQPPQYACGCLFILSEVLKARPLLWNTVLQNETVDEDIEHFEDIIEDLENVTDSAPSSKSESSISVTNIGNGVKTDDDSSDVEDEIDLPISYSEDDNSSEGEENLIGGGGSTDVEKFETVSDSAQQQAQVSNEKSSLPGGYNPRHREPSYCNADRASWWELTMLASHVHPSVATMARTLLSGVNIVYNGDPLNDLSLGAFLDKFMEKKPKPNRRAEGTWHGGSQIAPARKLDMGNHLIGEEILSLAEEDVPPEDLVFHKFYMNKTSSLKKPKKKKKQAEDEAAAEELFGVNGSDESDNEEIDDMLGSGRLPLENDGDYDYDDLDKVVDEGDDDLIGGGSDGDMDSPSEVFGGDFDDHDSGDDDGGAIDDDDDNVGVGDADDILDNEDINGDVDDDKFSGARRKNKKRKFEGRSRASPFANLEDYGHLLHEEGESARKKSKSRKTQSSLCNFLH